MHRTQGPDDTAGIYKETPPATVINANAMNALQEEIARTIEGAGLTVAASGAADAIAGWHQLEEAIRVHAGRAGIVAINTPRGELLSFDGPFEVAATSSSYTTSVAMAFMKLIADSGGSYPDGAIMLPTVGPNFIGRRVTMWNASGSRKIMYGAYIANGAGAIFQFGGSGWFSLVGAAALTTDGLPEGSTNKYFSGKDADDLPEGSTNLYFNGKDTDDLPEGATNKYMSGVSVADTDDVPEGSTNLYFNGKDADDLPESATKQFINKLTGNFVGYLYDSAGSPVQHSSASIYWQKLDGWLTIYLPQFTASIGAVMPLRITAASDSAFPSDARSAFDQGFTLWVSNNGGVAYISDRAVYDQATDKILIDTFTTGTSYVTTPTTIVLRP